MKLKRQLIVTASDGKERTLNLEWFSQYTQVFTGVNETVLNNQVRELRTQFPVVRPVIVASDPETGEILNLEPEGVRFKIRN